MKTLTFVLLFFISFPAFSTKVFPNCDIVFYKNDTLFLDKIFTKEILDKIKQEADFKINEQSLKVNNYTAYWLITDSKLYLVKVSSYRDSLDLKKSFRKRYENGKVLFSMKDLTIYMHKRFVLRYHWNWFSTYIEDYKFEFRNNSLFRVDTTSNYFDEESRLNRYSKYQLEKQVFQLISDSIKVSTEIEDAKKMQFNLSVEINNDGTFNKSEVSNMYVTNFSDSIYEVDMATNFIQMEIINRILRNTYWDQINDTKNDVVSFEFEYDFFTKEITSNRFIEYFEQSKKRELERIPWFIKY